MPETDRFTLRSYFRILTGILGEPRRFFTELAGKTAVSHAVWFLLISSLFFSCASLIRQAPPQPLLMGVVFTANGMGMALMMAAFGYPVAVVLSGKRISFARFFSVYAFSAGITLLAAWIPFFIWITEPWKLWLIATGMRRGFGFKTGQVLVMLGVSVPALILFFHCFFSIIAGMKTAG